MAAVISANETAADEVVSQPDVEKNAAEKRGPQDVKVFEFIDTTKEAAHLAWDSLSFSVEAPKGRKDILKGLSGDLRPGELTCILGPSGCGKTSFLNILAGRVRCGGKNSAKIGGVVKVNGQIIDTSEHQQLFGYVMQDDALLGTMTPREVLQFAARLRLGAMPSASRDDLVADLLQSLGLKKCADTMVGNELIKGISGGERKRTAVGAELITNPQITFLDEPTSGLDAGAAYDVISVLRQLALLKRSVLCTIHQPSSEVFHLFDQAIFLVGGAVAYHGPPSAIRDHFSRLDHECPKDYNPADFVMFVIQSKDENQVAAITIGWDQSPLRRRALTDAKDAGLPAVAKRKNFCEQLCALTRREAKNVFRDKGTLMGRFGIAIFLSSLVVLIFWQIGDTSDSAYDMQSHAGALTMVGVNQMFLSAQPLLLTFSCERPVFIREHASNMYGAAAYFLSKTVIELPLLLMQSLVAWCIVFWALHFNGNFFICVSATFMISMASASTSLLLACVVKDSKQAIEAAPAVLVPQVLFAGFFIKIELIPVYARWLQYLCALKWGMNILLWNEFDDSVAGRALLEVNEIDEDKIGMYYGVLAAIFVVFRALAMVALARKAKALYN